MGVCISALFWFKFSLLKKMRKIGLNWAELKCTI